MDQPPPVTVLDRAASLLARPGVEGRFISGGWSLIARRGGVSVPAGRLGPAEAEALLATGRARLHQEGGRAVLRAAGALRQGAQGDGSGGGSAAEACGRLVVELQSDADGASRRVVRDIGESPLAWLARRRGPDGNPLLSAFAFAAGERLRADFTRAGLSPRTGADWSGLPAASSRGGGKATETEAILAARQRFRLALTAAGTEFSGLLLDVCCFLKPLDAVEKERGWPARSAKVVLGLGLAKLADHYGLSRVARGAEAAGIRRWSADQA